MAKCEQGSEIYTDCINALQSVEEIGRLTLDHARDVGNTSQPAVGRGRQAGGRQGQGGRQSSQHHTSSRPPTSSRRPTPLHDHTMEEASQTTDEMSLDTAYDIGSMAHDDAGPSHTDDIRFMPTPGQPTLGVVPPEGVHTEFIQTQIPTPPPEPSHIEDRPQRPQRTRTQPPDCGTGHGTIVCTHPIIYTSLYS